MALPTVATVATFRAWFPRITDARAEDAAVQRAIDKAELLDDHGEPYCTLLAAAHFVEIAISDTLGTDDGRGTIKRRSIGPAEVEYVTPQKTHEDSFWSRSPYGREFLILCGTEQFNVMSIGADSNL